MSVETIYPYRHSGKFNPAGPLATLGAAVVLSIPLGLAYAYLVRWIPFIYLNLLITIGYGFAFGILCTWSLKKFKVRNNAVVAGTAFLAGLVALYGVWSGCLNALIDEAPIVASPADLWQFVQVLYHVGSWSMRSGDNVTGIVLAIVWLVEAGIIVGLTVTSAWGGISSTPFCETSQCWLEDTRTLDTLAAFSDPAQLAQLKAGDINPLLDAKPRGNDAWNFARITLRYSPRCDVFCTMQIENVTQEKNSKGEMKEKKVKLTDHLVLPPAMRELVEKFATFEAAPATTAAAAP